MVLWKYRPKAHCRIDGTLEVPSEGSTVLWEAPCFDIQLEEPTVFGIPCAAKVPTTGCG